MDLTDYDLNIYSYLLDLIFNMFVLIFDIFVVSFDMFLLISYQFDLNFNQFDLNFGLTIYSYSGQFASTATRASSPTSRNFLCKVQLRGTLGTDAVCPVRFDSYFCLVDRLGFPSSL